MRYDQDWHRVYGDMTHHSAHVILSHIGRYFPVSSAIEFGCGHAHWLKAAQRLGISDIKGLDGPWTKLDQLRIDPEYFQVTDLERPVNINRKFDLAICMEVGEHLQEAASSTLVQSMCRHADLVLFGAAIPLQGGFKHINEKWPSFWAEHFRDEGFQVFDLVRPALWQDTSIHYYYRQNALIYIKHKSDELVRRAEHLRTQLQSLPILDLVHPEKYLDYATYDSIVLKRLIPMLPRAIWSVIKRRIFF